MALPPLLLKTLSEIVTLAETILAFGDHIWIMSLWLKFCGVPKKSWK